MGRPKKQSREPFWRSGRDSWYVHHGTKTIRLSPDREEAWRLWHELMARPPEELIPPPPDARTVVEVLDLFLDWSQKNRDRLTYEAYRRRLQNLADAIPPALAYRDLKPYHLTRVTDAKGWNGTTKNDFIAAVQRAFNWALTEGIITQSPLARVKKPAREIREMAISPAQFAEIMQAVAEPSFRTLLEFAWETGARVQELRVIEARHVEGDRVVLPPKKAKGKKRYRVIYLGTERAKELARELCKEHPDGPILRNSEGNPWTKDAINSAFCRLEQRIGVKYHLGAFRKGYTTEGLKNGVDTVTMAGLLGHANAVMVSQVYGRVQQDPEYMAKAAKRAKGR